MATWKEVSEEALVAALKPAKRTVLPLIDVTNPEAMELLEELFTRPGELTAAQPCRSRSKVTT
jgi:hypothetical protein